MDIDRKIDMERLINIDIHCQVYDDDDDDHDDDHDYR